MDCQQVVDALRGVIDGDNFVPLHEPVFAGNEWDYVKECLDTGWVSSVGSYVDRFEEMLAEFVGVKRAVAVVNGTAALHVCLQLCGVGRDDEVLMPGLTFIATANAVSYLGAIPHFVIREVRTLGVDPARLEQYLSSIAEVRDGFCINRETGRVIRAVVPMHTFGHPVDLDPLAELCDRFCLQMIEDTAESLGSYYKRRHTGNWGRMSALSFNGNKIMTTGGGGAILTNDEELGMLAKHITTTAKVPHRWEFEHDMVGYNYRMPNLNAALGCAQIEQLPGFLVKKRKLAERYRQAFAEVPGVRFVEEPDFANSNFWLNSLKLEGEAVDQRDELLAATNDAGIMTRPIWKLMPELKMFANCPSMDLAVARDLERRILNIPSSASL